MWLVEKYGMEVFRDAVIIKIDSHDRGVAIEHAQPPKHGALCTT